MHTDWAPESVSSGVLPWEIPTDTHRSTPCAGYCKSAIRWFDSDRRLCSSKHHPRRPLHRAGGVSAYVNASASRRDAPAPRARHRHRIASASPPTRRPERARDQIARLRARCARTTPTAELDGRAPHVMVSDERPGPPRLRASRCAGVTCRDAAGRGARLPRVAECVLLEPAVGGATRGSPDTPRRMVAVPPSARAAAARPSCADEHRHPSSV
jgi:hypothetical protein